MSKYRDQRANAQMEWTARSQKSDPRGDAIAGARAAREARARARREQRPAVIVARAIGRRAHRNTFRRACAERCTKKAADISKLKQLLRAASKPFTLPAEHAGPLLRDAALAGDALDAKGLAQVIGVNGLADCQDDDKWRLRTLATRCWRLGLAQRNDALVNAVSALLERRDDVDLRRLVLDADGALRRAIRGKRGAFLEEAIAAAAISSRRIGEEALFARHLWPTDIVAVAGEAGKQALVGDGSAAALRALCEEGPLGDQEEVGVDAHARLLGTLGALGRRLLSAKHADSRAFADLVAISLQRTENASALFTDEDVVVAWRVVNGARTPATAPRELRNRATDLVDARDGCLGVLYDALVAPMDATFLDAPPSIEIALDALLAKQTADEFSEAAAKKKRSALADVVGSKWARKLEKTAGSMEKSVLRALGYAAPKPAAKSYAPTSKVDAPSLSPKVTGDAEAWALVCCRGLAACSPPLRLRALTQLTFRADAPRRVWTIIAARPPTYALAAYFGGSTSPLTGEVALACVSAALLRHALLVADDDDVLHGRPLLPFMLRRVLALYKPAAFACCWTSEGKDTVRDELFSWIVTLLRDLHARHCKRPLCKPKAWLVDSAQDARAELKMRYSRRSQKLMVRMPWCVSFRNRVDAFTAQSTTVEAFGHSQVTRVRVRRRRILDDGLAQVASLTPLQLRGRLSVQFVDDFGQIEAGIDAGGLFKEFWTELSKECFAADFGLFRITTHDGLLYPNPDSSVAHGEREALENFRFVGRVLGKALREGLTVQPRFARSFLSFLTGDFNYVTLLEDLRSLDPELHKNLRFLQLYEGDASDLGLDFTVSYERFGETITEDLRYNGSHIDVTNGNKHAYVQAVARFHMVDRLKKPSEAFVSGLGDAVDVHLLRAFAAPELQVLISGADAAIDVEDLRKHTRYENCSSRDAVVARFWAVCKKLSAGDRAALLKFVTACERGPSLGFGALEPPFTLRKIPDVEKLPAASTCFNTLKLPAYASERVLREQLLTSIHSGAGFDLS